MSTPRVRTAARRLALAVTATGAVTVLTATTAMAAPFATQATATALHLSVIDPVAVVDTGTESAQNDGSQPSVTDSQRPQISLLAGQSVLTAGLMAEVAVANNDGTSAACSGVTGEGGAARLGNLANCVGPGTTSVVLNLGTTTGGVSARIEADAITATCVGAADGTTTGDAELVNGRLVISQPLMPDVFVDLDTEIAPNTDLLSLVDPALATLLAPLVDVTLNQQVALDPAGAGSGYFGGLSVTAIDVNVIGDALADVRLANVTCGPSADLAIVPAIPLAGIPVALGTLAILGSGAALATKHRRRSAA